MQGARHVRRCRVRAEGQDDLVLIVRRMRRWRRSDTEAVEPVAGYKRAIDDHPHRGCSATRPNAPARLSRLYRQAEECGSHARHRTAAARPRRWPRGLRAPCGHGEAAPMSTPSSTRYRTRWNPRSRRRCASHGTDRHRAWRILAIEGKPRFRWPIFARTRIQSPRRQAAIPGRARPPRDDGAELSRSALLKMRARGV